MLNETTLDNIQAVDDIIIYLTVFLLIMQYLEIYDFIVVTWTSSDQSTSIFIDCCRGPSKLI
jgi:hypothetical protein